MFRTASGLWRRCFRCCAVRAAAVRAVHPDDMLSHSRCLTRSLGRSITALRQGNGVLARRATSGISSASQCVSFKNSPRCETRSSVYQIRYFNTTAAHRNEVITVKTPAFAESVTEGDVRWEKAVGDTVSEDEVVCEIETDKTSVQVPSPAAGVIEELLVPDGGKVEGGTPLFRLKKGAGAAKTAAAPPPAAETPAAAAAPPPPAAPAPAAAGPIPSTMPPIPPVPAQPIQSKPAARSEHRVKMNRMRLRIAQRLKEAQSTCAMLTTFNEVDMRFRAHTKSTRTTDLYKWSRQATLSLKQTARGSCSAANLVGIDGMEEDSAGLESKERARLRPVSICPGRPLRRAFGGSVRDARNVMGYYDKPIRFEGFGNNITEMRKQYKDAFLKKHVIDDTTKEIVYREYVDISVAVATPKGLVVPVIRGVEGMNFTDIEKTINELGEKARKNELAVEDMDGGTFTISNGGVFGSMFGTPIINPPQSAILGMHGIFDRPVAIAGKVEIRPMMYVALTYDHRLIDGREAVTFLRKIKSVVEDPRVLLLDM
ncbi:Dihydrolipoyllysine-residue succinyltransferase component of 2-oxoglutarate dehydrogenase complex, mitochondrial [Anabarilius grahami]|uniref:Dihydrolipoamide acetyltransferase component of pyruvate dehydrogenase complex n=1 Tax=Anabarilius grahami TaxID=495550 RepID=A0A3N0YP37_ANAGA|nr:Dihydrolipoyllysine-residue succinyltransferase component of 2-oxoglutarate dehydrogenase complex, mitochondrial [Anabarilius grahami]